MTRGDLFAPTGGWTGLVVVDKEPGWTSHDVVARCRRVLGQRRVGHAGTLDPDATGVLLVGVGRATRLLRFLTSLPKRYSAQIVLGTATSTLDASGETVGQWDMGDVGLDDIRRVAERFSGEIEQIPPMVSAVKIGGKRLHSLAREGKVVDRPARKVTVHSLEVMPCEESGVWNMSVECSSGTYVRVLAADIGEALGGGAHIKNLRRTSIGSFSEHDASRLDELDAQCILTCAQALRDMDSVTVDGEVASLVTRGLALDRVPVGVSGDGPWALLNPAGQLLAVYEGTETDRIKPAVVLA